MLSKAGTGYCLQSACSCVAVCVSLAVWSLKTAVNVLQLTVYASTSCCHLMLIVDLDFHTFLLKKVIHNFKPTGLMSVPFYTVMYCSWFCILLNHGICKSNWFLSLQFLTLFSAELTELTVTSQKLSVSLCVLTRPLWQTTRNCTHSRWAAQPMG